MMATMSSTMVVAATLAVLAAVLAGDAVTRLLRSTVPLPLVQIALGLCLGEMTGLRLKIDAEAFLLLFLPPLLFLDAWRIPKSAIRRDRRIIAELALGLVVATVVGLGFFIHWLIPALSLTFAFALAAVLSPTDAVAVSAIARRTPMPARMRHIIEGEALLNDASALVCLRFALLALATGHFSLVEAVPTFLWVAGAGLFLGAGFSWVIGNASSRMAARFGEDAGAHILATVLLPFGAYLLAEWFQASGILAAVAAGLVMPRMDRHVERAASTWVRRHATWDSIGFALNGAVFVLLGEQLSFIVHLGRRSAQLSGAGDLPVLVAYITIIALVLLAIRAMWIWASMQIDIARHPDRHEFARPPWLLIAASTLAGVRGTVTLVAVITIPRTLPNGTALPASAIACTVATGVILLSLIVASIGLPPLLRRLQDHSSSPYGRPLLREGFAPNACNDLEQLHHADSADLAQERATDSPLLFTTYGDALSSLQLAIVEMEREGVFTLHMDRRLTGAEAGSLLTGLDMAEQFQVLHPRSGR